MLHLLFRSTELTRDLATVVKPERRLERASRPIAILGEQYSMCCSYVNVNLAEWAGINIRFAIKYRQRQRVETIDISEVTR